MLSFLELLVVAVVLVVLVLVKFVQRVSLGWVRCLLGGPGVNCFFFFGLIGFHGSVRLEMILLHFASFPLNDTPKPAGAVFYSLAH